jgi:hypothetical protein
MARERTPLSMMLWVLAGISAVLAALMYFTG